jgi:cytochrome c
MNFRSWLLMAVGMAVAGMASAQSGADVAKSKGCLGCHDANTKKVGPAFKDVAAKYKDDKDPEAKIVAELKEGKGHPIKVNATDAELTSIVQYVLSVK